MTDLTPTRYNELHNEVQVTVRYVHLHAFYQTVKTVSFCHSVLFQYMLQFHMHSKADRSLLSQTHNVGIKRSISDKTKLEPMRK